MTLPGLEHGLLALRVGLLTGRTGWSRAVATVAGYVLHVAGELVNVAAPYQGFSLVHQALSTGLIGAGIPAIYLLMPLVGMLAVSVSWPRFEQRDIAR